MQTVHVRTDYTIDVPDYGTHLDTDQIRDLVTRSGSHFFDRDTMRAFKSKVDVDAYAGPDGWYFVTSEKHESHTSYGSINEPRMYTVRFLTIREGQLRLYELEAFQHFATLRRARTAAKHAAAAPAQWCPVCNYRLYINGETGAMCQECARRGGK